MDKEKFIYYMKKMYAERNPNLPYFGIKGGLGPFQDDPRYIALMEKIGMW